MFIDLSDQYGITQIVVSSDEVKKQIRSCYRMCNMC